MAPGFHSSLNQKIKPGELRRTLLPGGQAAGGESKGKCRADATAAPAYLMSHIVSTDLSHEAGWNLHASSCFGFLIFFLHCCAEAHSKEIEGAERRLQEK